MEIVGKYKYKIEAYLTDFRGQATLPMIGGFMLQAASRHAEERDFGYSYMIKEGKVWVLSRLLIEVNEYPKNDTEITLHTWVSGLNKLFSERSFAFYNSEGKEIGYARSLWAAIDLETRRLSNVLDLPGIGDFMHDRVTPIESPGKVNPLKEEGEIIDSFAVKYSDIDINKHLNSMKSIEHFCNAFPISEYENKDINSFLINYIQEGQYGSKMDILQKSESVETRLLEMREGETTICLAKVIWK